MIWPRAATRFLDRWMLTQLSEAWLYGRDDSLCIRTSITQVPRLHSLSP